MKRKNRYAIVILILFGCFFSSYAEIKRSIPNLLGREFPHELVYIDFDINDEEHLKVVSGMVGEERPVQVERINKNGKDIARAWFIATILADQEEKGKPIAARKVDIVFKKGNSRAGIQVKKEGSYYLIDNGVYEFKLREYGNEVGGKKLSETSHWIGGMRLKGAKWDGKAYFEGNAKVISAKTEILNQGPVFYDFKISYEFESENSTSKKFPAIQMMLGKRSFEYEPNKIPEEEIERKEKFYEILIRFVAGDPWIEVVERFAMPKDETVPGFGIHQYWIYWGETGDLPEIAFTSVPKTDFNPIDMVMYVPWFEYDSFGGNNKLQILPAKPRPAQKGRPFALLRPRWNQGGGGAQEFFLTYGISSSVDYEDTKRKIQKVRDEINQKLDSLEKEIKTLPANDPRANTLKEDIKKEKAKVNSINAAFKNWDNLPVSEIKNLISSLGNLPELPRISDENFDDSPAFGIVAAYPSKWVNPYPCTITAYAAEKRTCVRVPLTIQFENAEEIGKQAYGARCYAICVGKRKFFDNTNKMNSFIRRHTDWTLVANINKYVLDWPRNDSAKSPKIMLNSKQLDELRKEYENPSTEEIKKLKESAGSNIEKSAKLNKQLKQLEEEQSSVEKQISSLENQIKNEKDASKKKQLDEKLKEVKQKLSDVKGQIKNINNQIKDFESGMTFGARVALLLANKPLPGLKDHEMPKPDMFLQTRYQDDSCNPTNYGVRRMVNHAFPTADLFSAGAIFGGPQQAAVGYIFTDLDAWPGWHNGWTPGNPNFHTDKYIASIFAGAVLADHPHAGEWLKFGLSNLEDDLRRVVTAPDGVGYECPGYSAYSLGLQLEAMRTLFNSGYKNIPQENELIKKTARWHRKLITPFDIRLKRRHEAPLGDTHRWDAGLGPAFRDLAIFYKETDPEFASELVGTYKLLVESGAKFKEKEFSELFSGTIGIKPMEAIKMDWSSEKFEGFGAILRNNFGTNNESFVTLKAGSCRGHYHNDELSYHLYLVNSPVSLDYNCSYTPRGDHACLHNSVCFGKEGEIRNNTTGKNVPSAEQDTAIGKIVYFGQTESMDIAVAEKRADQLMMSPIYPQDAEFGRDYPRRKTEEFVHRRWLALVKHPEKSKFNDYLVVYDETRGNEPRSLNIHLLSRIIERKNNLFYAVGQYDKDFVVFLAAKDEPGCEIRSWGYLDEFMDSPGAEYELKIGETQQEYMQRMQKLGSTLPLSGWEPKWNKNEKWQKLAIETNYQSLIPPPNWKAAWLYGEYQQWLKIDLKKDILWLIYAYEKGKNPPEIISLNDGKTIKISIEGETEEITFDLSSTKAQVVLKRDNKEQVILKDGIIPVIK